MKKLPYLPLTIMFLFLAVGCEQEQPIEVLEDAQVASLHFSLDDITDPFLREALYKIETTAVNEKEIEGVLWKEYPIRARGGELKSEQYGKAGYLLLEAKGPSIFDQYFIVKMLPEKKAKGPKEFSYLNAGNFNGMAYLYRPEGGFERAEYFRDGEVLSGIYDGESLDEKVPNTLPKTARCGSLKSAVVDEDDPAFTVNEEFDPEEPDCGGGNFGGRFVDVPVYKFIDWYSYRGDGWYYTNTSPDGVRYETVWVVDEIQANVQMASYVRQIFASGSSSVPQPGSHAYEQLMEGNLEIPDRVTRDESFIGTTADCVFKRLQELNGDLFKETIGEFIDDPVYNLTFEVGDCTRTDEACTDASDVQNIVVTIENVNQSGLGIAALILHESLHSEMHRYVSRFESGVDANNRPRLFQLYAYYKGWATEYQDPNYNWTEDAHHAYMVENYVEKIASAIRQLDNNAYPLSHYMAYGWDGLTSYGYAANRLNEAENSENQRLRQISDSATSVCN